MNSNTIKSSVPKPVCVQCEGPLTWLSKQLHGPFCSSHCRTRYQEVMTQLAMERLHAAMPKRVEKTAERSGAIIHRAQAETRPA